MRVHVYVDTIDDCVQTDVHLISNLSHLKRQIGIFQSSSLSEPGERVVEKGEQSDERDQVGSDVSDQLHGQDRTGSRCVDQVAILTEFNGI